MQVESSAEVQNSELEETALQGELEVQQQEFQQEVLSLQEMPREFQQEGLQEMPREFQQEGLQEMPQEFQQEPGLARLERLALEAQTV